MALSSSKKHPAPTPDKEIPTYLKGNKVKCSSNCPKTTTLKIRTPKIPNTKVPKWARQDDNQYNDITQFLINHPIYRTLGGVPQAIYAKMIFEFWATCKKKEKNSLSGTVLNGSKTISFSAEEVRKCLRLRKGAVEPVSLEKAKKLLLSRTGYMGKLNKKVERKFMLGIWNYLFAHISECLGMKSGGFDQPNALEIQIAHALFTGRDVDYASLLTRDMIAKASAKKKSKCVPYVRILGLLIQHGLNDDFTGATGHTIAFKELGSKVFQNPATGQRLTKKMREYLKPSIQVQGDDDDDDDDDVDSDDDDDVDSDDDDDDSDNDNDSDNDDDDDDHNVKDSDNDDDHNENEDENDDDQVNPSSHDTLEIPTHPSTRVTDSFVQQQTMEDLTSKAESENLLVGNALNDLARLTNYVDDILAKVQKQQDGTKLLLSQAVAYVKSLRQEYVSKFDAAIQALESKLCARDEDPSTIATKEQPEVDFLTNVVPQTALEAIHDLLGERNVEYHFPSVKKRRVVHADIVNGSYTNKEQNVLSPSESRDTSVAELSNTQVVVNQDNTFNNRKGMLMGDSDVQRHDSEDKTMMDVSESTTNGESTSTSDNMLPKVVMEGSRSNATKEGINEDNPLPEMVINVEYHSIIATKEQRQVDSSTKVVPHTVPKAIDDSLQGVGKKHNKGRKQRKISTLCESVPAPTPAPSLTPALINRPVSPTRLPEPSEDAMPSGRMRGGLEGEKLEAARLELLAPPRQPIEANDPWSIPTATVPLEVLMK